MVPFITLEEHFLSKAIGDSGNKYSEQLKWLPGVGDKLSDLGQLRLEEMEKGHISLQVISHAPGPASPEQCAAANDQLAAAVAAHKSRFAGFATLPMSEPKKAADELTRCVNELGFVGALIDNHDNGRYYDAEEYWPVFERAEALDVPIYIHPTWPSEDMAARLQGNFSNGAAVSMGSSGFGWHADVHLHILRLFAAGVFDVYPKLKIIIGHMGEMLPFQLERTVYLSSRWGERKRGLREVWDGNIWITTSGMWSVNPLACVLRNTKIERILYSVDYPFAKNEDGLKFMKELQESGMVTEEQFAMIAYKNAESLLKIKVENY